jgi:aquaporin NIP
MSKYVSEFIATFTLLLAILEAIVITAESSHGLFIVSLVAGLAVTILIYGFRKYSGAHMNPAVSTAMWLDNQLTTKVYFGYFAAQLLGSVLAAFVIELAHGDTAYVMGITVPSLTEGQAWLMEAGLTFLLIFAIFRCTDASKPKLDKFLAPLIGLIVFLEIYFAGPYTGASMNPARSFGPALVEGQSEYHWLYFSAPLFGAAVARYFDLIFRKKTADSAELKAAGE